MFYLLDWSETFAPSVCALFDGGMFNLYNPPWVLFPLIPFALLPREIGSLLVYVLSLAALLFVARRLNLARARTFAFLLSYSVLTGVLCGNVEWLALLGLVINPLVGIPLMLIKPQLTVSAIVFVLAESARQREWKRLAQISAIIAGLLALSFWLDSSWVIRTFSYNGFVNSQWNFSLFPVSVPIGVAFLIVALRTRQIGFALMASPMFFAVVTPQCWMVVILGLAMLTPAAIVASLGIWFYVLRVRFA